MSDYQKEQLLRMQQETRSNIETEQSGLFKNILKAKEKKLNNFKLKNKIQDLPNDDIDTLAQQLLKTDSDAARTYAEQLSNAKNLQGTEKTSQLFNLLQQPAFRALLRKGESVS